MEFNFKQYTEVNQNDAALRNAIRLDCAELVQRAIAKGADVNCRYAEDWNTPLHLAINNRCQSSVLSELMSHRLDYGLVNGDNLTAGELALWHGLKSLARELIEKEFEIVGDPMEAICEMLSRNSVEALEMLLEVLCLSGCSLAECLSMAWSKLEVMNVVVNPELEVFVHLTLIRLDYDRSFGKKESGSSQVEIQEHLRLLITEIELLEQKFDTGLCHDVSDEFLEVLRLILKHLFVVKNRLDKFPAMQLEYCIVMYLAVFYRKPELDLYQLVINKRLVIEFLKLFRSWYNNPYVDQRMSHELLNELTVVMLNNKMKKCKYILEWWTEIVKSKYTRKELAIIWNKLLKSNFMSKLSNSSETLDEPTKLECALLKAESESINKMFESIKTKPMYKSLNRTFFKLKQMYSLQKSVQYLSVIENIELNPARCCYTEILAIQRVLQVLGETLKSTRLSPNISTNLRSVLEYVSPGDLLKWVSKLRQYFSHDYSATKHTIYRRLRVNDIELIDFFRRVKADLLKVLPLLGNIYTDHVYRFFKTFLGYSLAMKSVEHVRSYAEASRVRPGFKLDHDFQSSDFSEIRKQLAELELHYDPECHGSNLEVVAKIYSKIDVFVGFLESRSINFMTEMVMGCIGELLLCERLDYQKNLAQFYLGSAISPKSGGYGAATFLMQSCNPLIRQLLAMEARSADANSINRMIMIQKLLNLASVKEIQQLHELTLLKDKSLTNFSQRISNALVAESLSDEQFEVLSKMLQKYYANLFAIDDKYRIVKTFCKSNKLKYKMESVAQLRKEDMNECQKVLTDLVLDMAEMVSLPENMSILDLVSLIAPCVVYKHNRVELFALETVLLEVLEILSNQGILTDNRSMIMSYRSVISGRNLRNYLAHDGLTYETICRNRSPVLTLLLNAICLTRYCNVELYSKSQSILKKNSQFSVSNMHEWVKSLVGKKSNVFMNIKKGNYDFLPSDGVELKSRDCNNQSVLIALINHHSEQVIHLLLEKPSKAKPLMEALIRGGLNQEHNFYDDDEFTVAQLIHHQSIRENMTFYLALKYHHFELEKELDLLYGGAYTEDSLHMAIIFKNERSALAIIDDNRLYTFCKNDAWNFRNSILANAVLHKLPKVVRRICEVSPELIERTNTNQETALRIAIASTCKENVEILLEHGAKVFTKEKPPIIYALHVRKDELLDIILPSNEELLNNEQLLNQLVVNASSTNHIDLLERLLPMVKSRFTLVKSLSSAVIYSSLKVVQILLNYDPSILNELSEFDCTVLFQASYFGRDTMAELLLERGADCTVPSHNSALQCAIDRNRHKQFKMMLHRPIENPDIRNHVFRDLFSLSRYNWIWSLLRAGLPCNIGTDQSSVREVVDNSVLKFLLKLIRFKKDVIHQIDTYILANAVLLRNHKFVEYVLDRLDNWNRLDRTRLLNCAVKANDKELLCLLIEAGCSVNSADADGITPLATAVSVGKPDMVKFLIKHKADPNLESMGNCSVLLDAWNTISDNIFDLLGGKYFRSYPIIQAAAHSFRKIAEYLLKKGAEADIRNENGCTALIVAMSLGDVELADALIRHGASVDHVRSFSFTTFKDGCALHFAATYGHLDMIKRMVDDYHFDSKAKDSDGNNALHLAVINNHVSIVEYFLHDDHIWEESNKSGNTPLTLALNRLDLSVFQLLKSKPNLREAVRQFRCAQKRTLLHVAVLKEAPDLVHTLLREFDIDCYSVDQAGNTALHYAVLKKNFDLIKLLTEAGISLTGPSGLSSMPPFVIAVLQNQLDVVHLYIEKENDAISNLRQYCADGINLLISSIMQKNFAMCKLLLSVTEFDLNDSFENGNTALHVAAKSNLVQIIDLLVQHGSHIDGMNQDGKTALIIAIEHGSYRVAHYLLNKGASRLIVIDYRYKGDNGMNLLHYVAAKGELNSLKFLLNKEFFARTEPDKIGMTIGHYAAFHKQHAVMEFLITSQFPVDQLDNEGRSSLVFALENEDLQLAKRLKSIGCSLDVVQFYSDKHNFMIRALDNKKMDLVKFLTDECFIKCSTVENVLIELAKAVTDKSSTVDESGKSHSNSTSSSPLIQQVLAGNIKLVEQLIDDEPSLEEVSNYRVANKDQDTLLHVVVRNGFSSVLRLLLEKSVFNVDVGDVDQTTALQVAAMLGQKDCVELLLQHGANIDFVDMRNTTALTRACINSQKEVAEMLLEHGADPDNTRTFRFEARDNAPSLHIAVLGDLSLLELLVRKVEIDVNVMDSCGRTALHLASVIGSIEAVEELLKLGARQDIVDHDRRTPFVAALMAGHEKVAERLLAATHFTGYLRDFRTPESLKSVLHVALDKGFIRLLMLLLYDHGLSCSYSDVEGKTILHCAVANGDVSLIEQLKIGSDLLFLADKTGETPLSICLKQSNFKVFEILIQSLANSGTLEQLISVFESVSNLESSQFVNHYSKWLINVRKSCISGNKQFAEMITRVFDMNPFLYAINKDHKDLLELFLETGVDRSFFQNSDPTTWLHVAAMKNWYHLAKVMLDEFNVPVDCLNEYGKTPLFCAAIMPQTETARLLLERGANANFQDVSKRTPLQTALEFNHGEMVRLLLEYHASIPLLQEFRYHNDNEHLVQHYLVERGLTEMLSMIMSKIDINHGDKFGMTALHYAAGCNQLEMIDLLVSAGAEVDCFDVHRTTPLIRAVSKNHLEAYRKLVALGANVDLVKTFRNENFDGEAILHITAEKNRIEATKLLVEDLKCDVDCVDKKGNTPLHYAVQNGCFKIVKYLLGKNASMHLKNSSGRTVLQLLEKVNCNVEANVTNS